MTVRGGWCAHISDESVWSVLSKKGEADIQQIGVKRDSKVGCLEKKGKE